MRRRQVCQSSLERDVFQPISENGSHEPTPDVSRSEGWLRICEFCDPANGWRSYAQDVPRARREVSDASETENPAFLPTNANAVHKLRALYTTLPRIQLYTTDPVVYKKGQLRDQG